MVEFRKQMIDAVRAFQNGEPAIGTGAASIPPTICSFQAIVPKTTDWRAFSAKYVWDDSNAPVLEPSYSTAAQ